MSDIKATVNTQKTVLKGKLTPNERVLVTKYNVGVPVTGGSINGAPDIDISGLADGAMLVWSSNSSLWIATTQIENNT